MINTHRNLLLFLSLLLSYKELCSEYQAKISSPLDVHQLIICYAVIQIYLLSTSDPQTARALTAHMFMFYVNHSLILV